jgi:hypothetical protein
MPPERKSRRPRYKLAKSKSKKPKTVGKSDSHQSPEATIKSETDAVPDQRSDKTLKPEEVDDEDYYMTFFPQPTVPEGHKIVHVLRHFRAWHKYILIAI